LVQKPGATLFDLGGLQEELGVREHFGCAIDLVAPADLPAKFRGNVLSQALPVA